MLFFLNVSFSAQKQVFLLEQCCRPAWVCRINFVFIYGLFNLPVSNDDYRAELRW
jgi:hypothetical protein